MKMDQLSKFQKTFKSSEQNTKTKKQKTKIKIKKVNLALH